MNDCFVITLTAVEVYCPHCTRFQYVELSEFHGEDDTRTAEDVDCSGCGHIFDIELEVVGL